MAEKKIWVACGSAVASSTMAAHILTKMCEERGLDVEIELVAYRDIGGKPNCPDLVIVLAPGIDATTYPNLKGVPFIMGLAFITGINKDQVMNEVEEILKG
jgi:PTS system galactitol-specific IIB component